MTPLAYILQGFRSHFTNTYHEKEFLQKLLFLCTITQHPAMMISSVMMIPFDFTGMIKLFWQLYLTYEDGVVKRPGHERLNYLKGNYA